MRKYSKKNAVLLFLCVRLSINCATIIHGSTQDVDVASAPDNAVVWMDGARVARTPARLALKRGDSHLIEVVKDGYKMAAVKIDKYSSDWVIGNIIFGFGGIIGCVIDFTTGGAYVLKPERVDFNLTKIAQLNGQPLEIQLANLDEIKEFRFLDDHGNLLVVAMITWAD